MSTDPVMLHQQPPRSGSMGISQTVVLFGGALLLLLAVTRGLIPALVQRTRAEPILIWFAAAGIGVFLPLVFMGGALLIQERLPLNLDVLRSRLRLQRMIIGDWLWTLGGALAIAVLATSSLLWIKVLLGNVSLQPSFIQLEPLTPGRYWILAAWLPFFAINIMGEELLWRGVILPRQETALGRWAWLANGLGWLGFHLSFGPSVLLVLWPTTLIIPYIVQRRGNTWIGILIHAALNGGGFLAIAFGLL